MKAYLLNALQVNGKFHEASTDQRPNIVDLDDAEYDRLEAMLVIRKPTKEEVALFDVLNADEAEVVSDKPKRGRKAKLEGETAPAGEGTGEGGTNDEDDV